MMRHTLASTHQPKGFSLIELILTLSIVAIIASLAAPDLRAYTIKLELNTKAKALQQALNFARSQALARQTLIHVCQLDHDQKRCSPDYAARRSWSKGWLIFADLNENNEYDREDLLLRIEKLDTSVLILFNQNGRLRFFPNGSSRSAGFYFCEPSKTHFGSLKLLYSGRVRYSQSLDFSQQTRCLELLQI